jgi:hypothetical protein
MDRCNLKEGWSQVTNSNGTPRTPGTECRHTHNSQLFNDIFLTVTHISPVSHQWPTPGLHKFDACPLIILQYMAGKLKWRGTARFIDFVQFFDAGTEQHLWRGGSGKCRWREILSWPLWITPFTPKHCEKCFTPWSEKMVNLVASKAKYMKIEFQSEIQWNCFFMYSTQLLEHGKKLRSSVPVIYMLY